MNIQTFTKAGKVVNEDAIFVCENFGFVIDGATGLAPEKITPSGSDAEWFASQMRDYLSAHLDGRDLPTVLTEALIHVNNEFKKFDGSDNLDLMPSAGIAMFQIVNDNIEYFVLGDCSILFRCHDGEIVHYHCEDLENFDKQNIQLMVQHAIKQNINVIDARPLIQADLQRVRNLKNKTGGYWILSDNIEAVKHGIHGYIDKNKVKDILLTSDGYSQIFDLFKTYTKQELFNILSTKNLENIYKELYNLQEEDRLCNSHPRFKIRDDASAGYFEF